MSVFRWARNRALPYKTTIHSSRPYLKPFGCGVLSGRRAMSILSQQQQDDDDDKGPMRKVKAQLPYAFEKELTEKQNKRIYIVDEFIATERVTPIEGKFYSKFNDVHIKDIRERQCFWKLAKEQRNGSMIKLEFPVLESQMYGWIPRNVSKLALKRINYIAAPKLRCPMTIYGEKLSSERVTERTEFTGERFYLT